MSESLTLTVGCRTACVAYGKCVRAKFTSPINKPIVLVRRNIDRIVVVLVQTFFSVD